MHVIAFEAPSGFRNLVRKKLFNFREQGSTGNYFRAAIEQNHSFGELGITAQKAEKNKLRELCRSEHYSSVQGAHPLPPPPPPHRLM